jgi:bacterioferritin-associated ferredoxin
MKYRVEIPGRDCIEYEIEDSGKHHLKVIGCTELLELVRGLKKSSPQVEKWSLPKGDSHANMLVRELILKVQGLWQFPITDPETCHCRAVPTEKVDQAVVCGAHEIEKIRRLTSANTACGTCFPDVQKIINYRLQTGLS